jgi:hypothetical protein
MGPTLLKVCVCVLGDHPSGLKPPEREANDLPKCSADDTRRIAMHFHPIDRHGIVFFY